MKRTLLFVITQFYRGGAETALVNLHRGEILSEISPPSVFRDQKITFSASF